MRAALCPQAGEILVRDAEIPRPTREGEVLLRVRRCGICGSDLHWYKGESPPPQVCPGHEVSGVVAALGPGPHHVREGDRVVAEGIRACGRCGFCHEGRPQLCARLALVGSTAPGGFADYLLTDARHVHRVPDGVDDETAQLAEPLAVGVHGLRLAGFERGQRALVLGGGTIGLLAAAVARTAGAAEVVVSARRPHQHAAATRLGADGTIEAADLRRALVASEMGDFDVALDTVADATGSLDDGLLAVRPGGTVVVVGVYRARPALDALRLMMREIRVVGAMCYGRAGNQADFGLALDILAREGDRIRAAVLTHRVRLESLAEGFRLAADKSTGSIKVSVAISDDDRPAGP